MQVEFVNFNNTGCPCYHDKAKENLIFFYNFCLLLGYSESALNVQCMEHQFLREGLMFAENTVLL